MRLLLLLPLLMLIRDIAALNRTELPPSLKGAVTFGCSVNDSKVEGQPKWWHVRVWIQFPDKKWIHLYAVRADRERDKTLNDCKSWLKAAENAMRKEAL